MSWAESYFEGKCDLVEHGSQNQGREDASKPQVPHSSVRIKHALKISFSSNTVAIFLVDFVVRLLCFVFSQESIAQLCLFSSLFQQLLTPVSSQAWPTPTSE